MVCFRSRRLAAGLFVCGVVLGACGKKEESSQGGGNGATGAKNQDLQLIPVDSELVLGLNLAQARDSGMVRGLQQAAEKRPKVQALLEKIRTKCGFDPLTAVSSITLGAKNLGGNLDGVIVIHGLEKAKALPCVDQLKDELAAQKVEVTRDGDVVLAKGGGTEETAALTFVDDKTAILVVGPKGTKAGALEVAQGKSTLSTSKEFTDMYSRVKTGDTLWLLLNGAAEPVADLLSKINVKSKAVFGSVNAANGLSADLRMRVESEDQATNVAKLLESQVAPFAQFADKVEIVSDKSDVRVTVSFTEEKLKSVMGLAQAAFGSRR